MSSAHILIADDDDDMADGVAHILEREGHSVERARDGGEAAAKVRARRPDLLILDVMMPRRDGLSVLRELRSRGETLPILVLSAKGQEVDKVLGLELGADDYLAKPFGIAELLARVNVQLRRSRRDLRSPTIAIERIAVDFDRRLLRCDGREHTLSTHEAQLLRVFAAHAGETVSRRQLLGEVWGDDSVVTNRVIDFHVTNLRRKLAEVSGAPEPRLLLTVHGIGYRLVAGG
jgi:DNA-binding response OmpR family regulator